MVVYKITNQANGKVYIGKTVRPIAARWRQHVNDAKRHTLLLSRAITKYGAESFQIDPLYAAQTVEELNIMEKHFIVEYQSNLRDKGYNLTLGGDGASPGELNPMWGKTHTDKVKAKLRALRLGSKNSPESNEKRRQTALGNCNYFYGKKHTDETRKKISEKVSGKNHPMFGKKRSPEFGQQVSRALTGIVRSEETCRRISESKKGTIITEETRQKISESVSKVPRTPEWRARISAALKGRPKSVEHRRHLSESRHKRGKDISPLESTL